MKKTDLAALEASVRRSFWIVTGVAASVLAIYSGWFFAHLSLPVSNESSAWGQFGDFVGGILNPLVAYSAFFWLTRSVLLQKEELLETRHALEDTAKAAVTQAKIAAQAMRVSAVTALLNASVTEVQSLRAESSSLALQASKHAADPTRLPNGDWVSAEQLVAHLKVLASQISHHAEKRAEYEAELKTLLASMHGAA